jgi:hypothetical protein
MALKKMAVCKWITLARCGEEEQKDALRSGGPRDDVIDNSLRSAIDDDPHLSCNALANILSIAAARVWPLITESIWPTYIVARWITHNLNSEDRQSRVALSQERIPVLVDCCKRNWKAIVTRDENLCYSSYCHSGKRVIDPDDYDSVPSKGLEHRKVILTAT